MRTDEDGRNILEVDDYRDALGRIGNKLGLRGAFHLIADVERAVDELVAAQEEAATVAALQPEGLPRLLEGIRIATRDVRSTLRSLARAEGELSRASTRLRRKAGGS